MEGDQLIFLQDGAKSKIYFTSDTDFFMKEIPNGEFSFLKGRNGEIEAVQLKRRANVTKFTKVL
jgi:replicative DNA helicase